MIKFRSIILLTFILCSLSACLQNPVAEEGYSSTTLQSGADQTELYYPLLAGKNIALAANHSSLIGQTHLADTLLASNINLVKVFAPEHGFRGLAGAGEFVEDGTDIASGLKIVSLYGSNKKPSQQMLEGIDLILFDMQDVGVRFYTYISTLTYIMEAAAEKGIEVVVLDRPNPNGFYIDGPVMEEQHRSFVGMHAVPIVYGMTIGEYARMINGEGWLSDNKVCKLEVIPLKNYDRSTLYKMPVKPSPNLPSWQSVYLYPSLCLFEGTVVSVGRGTDHPFTVFGHPSYMIGSFAFVPESRAEAKYPKLEGKLCTGMNLSGYADNYRNNKSPFTLEWLISAYKVLDMGDTFFIPYFEKLAGTSKLREQIIDGLSEHEIRNSWADDLEKFKLIRKKYLIYEDAGQL